VVTGRQIRLWILKGKTNQALDIEREDKSGSGY
jgi:hypothetical protein